MSTWLDNLPGNERQRIKEKFRLSEAAYEKLREKVKGPEDLQKEMLWNESMAQLKFGLETEPHMGEALKKQIEKDIKEKGIEDIIDIADLPENVRLAIEQGKFEVTIDAPSPTAQDQIVIQPEGNITDKLPVQKKLSQVYVAQLQGKSHE